MTEHPEPALPEPAPSERVLGGRRAGERRPHEQVLITAEALRELVPGGRAPRLLDVRWSLANPDGREAYRSAHLPGAVYVDLDDELAAHGAPTDGRHPLPSIEALQAAARRWGLRRGEAVVVYDDSANLAAARAWWLLRWAGLADVRLLDGGLAAWQETGGRLEGGDVVVPTGDVELSPGHLPVLDADGAADLARTGLLLDARAAERYRGEVEPVDPRAGHIPGAVSAPTTQNVDPTGRMRPAAELARQFASLGAREGTAVGVYCGSGVTASHEIAALAAAGITAALYPGSWSAWSNDPARPAAVGPQP